LESFEVSWKVVIFATIIKQYAIMTVREMKNDMVHMINQMDESSEEKVKDMWLYVKQIVKPTEKEEVLTPDQKRRLELVDKLCGAFSACQTVDFKKDKEEYMLEKYGQ
jgi:hypothetical protein